MKIPSLSIAAPFAVFFTVLLSLLQPAQALLVEYKGDEVASAPWSFVGTAFTTSGTAESITFGPGAIWAQQAATDPGSEWDPDLTSGFVEVKFQIDVEPGAGFATGVAIYTGTRDWNILLGVDVVSVNGSTETPTLSLATMYTLRLDYDLNGLDVSLDGSPLANLQNIGSSGSTAAVVYLHRYTGSIATDGQATFFDVSWDAVPEPGTMGLLAVGSLFGFVASGRRRRSGRSGA